MENALFLGNDNRRHLLGMKGNFEGQRAPWSFTKLVLSVIKILSGVSLLRRSSSSSSQDEKMGCISYGNSHLGGLCGMELFSQESFTRPDQRQISGHQGIKSGVEPTRGSGDELWLKLRVESSQAGLCSGTSRNSECSVAHISDNSEDPFAFDEDDFKPSKWNLLFGSSNKSLSQDSRAAGSQYRYESHYVPLSSQQESNDVECRHYSQRPLVLPQLVKISPIFLRIVFLRLSRYLHTCKNSESSLQTIMHSPVTSAHWFSPPP